MPAEYVQPALRKRVMEQARRRCGYCLCPEELLGMPLTIEHIIPLAAGGQTVEQNLWLSCHRCNNFKGTRTAAIDPVTQDRGNLFNPRHDSWHDHFEWSEDGTLIVGRTPMGRATVFALNLNNREVVVTRRLWVSVGWWPPQD